MPDLATRHWTERVDASLFDRLRRRVTIGGGGLTRPSSPVVAPSSGEPFAEAPLGTGEDVAEAVCRGRAAQRAWGSRSCADRARVFLRYHDLVLERQDLLLDVLQIESGKARKHAFEEVADVAIVSRYYAIHARRHLRPRRRKGALPVLTATWEHHHPLGVVGIISPWNYPLSLSMTDAIAALMAGNAVVLKPDQQTPYTALAAIDLLYEAGLPADLFQVVTGRGRELGGPLIQLTDSICFTGSTQTGRTIARLAGERLVGCSLELGGKNPMLVLADADLEYTATGAERACFANAGQLCISIERLYVERPIYDRFLELFGARTRAMKLGSSFDYGMDMGSLASRDQLEKVQSHVNDAVSKGATAVAGGRARPELGPFFFEPTILTGVTDEMTLAKDETFGPVVSIYPFDTIDEAIERANATPFGLNACIWTRNTRRGRRIATRIRSGTVNVNEAYAATWASVDAPMGGCKDSGLGRRHGAQGILKYTEAQTVSVQRILPIAAAPVFSERGWARFLSTSLRLIRRIPGLR